MSQFGLIFTFASITLYFNLVCFWRS